MAFLSLGRRALLALADPMAATPKVHDLGVVEETVKQDAGGDEKLRADRNL